MPNATFCRRLFSQSVFFRFALSGLTYLLFATSHAYAALDYGDAPASYGDASHTIVNGLYLGQIAPDAEAASQYSFNAFGDGDAQTDGAGTWYFSGDEDGAPRQPVSDYIALFPVLKMTAMNYSVNFQVTNDIGGNNAGDARLFGWIDFDGNGTFDDNEGASVLVTDGSNNATVTLSWAVPFDIKLGSTFIRLRLTTDPSMNTSTPAGTAADGEVEDFVLAVALDIPPDSTSLTVLSEETPLTCQSVVLADDFDDVAINSGAFLAPNRGVGGGSVETLRDWAVTGGGADSYARVYDASAFSMGSAVYLGNGAVRRISPAIGAGFSFDSQGRVTNTIDAIELRDTADDSTPGSTLMGWGTASHWGPEPITLSRSFSTEIGKTYRLYFKAVPEDGSFEAGAMRINLPGGSVHIKIPGSDEDTIDYAIEFTALNTLSTLGFVNYGHVNARGGIGWCDPVSEYANNSWCTVGGGDVNGNELIIDEVVIAEADCGVGSISGVVYTDSNSNDSFDTPTEAGINEMAVTLFNDNGSAADLSDDIQVGITSTDTNGGYSFANVDARNTYRLEVDVTDPDLPGQLSIGSTNPLTGITVSSDNDTGNQNFGFDPFTYSCPTDSTPKIESGFASAVIYDLGVAYEQNTLNGLAATGAQPSSLNAGLIASSDVLVLDLGEFVPEAAILQLSLARNGSQGKVEIAVSPFNSDFTVLGTFGDDGTLGTGKVQELEYLGVLVPAGGARFVRFSNVTASTWVDGVAYNAVCVGADNVVEISGTVYQDSNTNDAYDSATEPGLSSITVSLLNDADDSVITLTATDSNGAYQFAGLPADKVYRVSVSITDSNLPIGASLGTANPLTGLSIAAGGAAVNQNFGFDQAIVQPPFTCDTNIYIGSSTAETLPAQLYAVGTSASPFTLNTLGNTAHGHSYNAMGYREQDDYLYAIKQSSSNLLRIGADGSMVDLGAVSGLPVPSNIWQTYDSGDVFPDGYLYIHEVASHAEIYKIDVTTTPPSLVQTINLSQSIWLSDFAYNKVDNKVYGVGDQGEKFMIDPTTWAVSTVGSNTSAASYGAAYTDSQGNVYVYKNDPGTFYQVDFGLNGTGTGAMIELSTAPNVSFNDGASCRGGSPVAKDVLEGKVWFDTNSDGVQNGGVDSYIEGATVELFDPVTSTVIATTTSNTSGRYEFSNSNGMQPGTNYQLRIMKLDNYQPISDWAITSLQAGTDTTLDSDAILVGNYWQIDVITPVSGSTSSHDFGFVYSSVVGCLEEGSNGVSDESIANSHPTAYDFLFDGQQVSGYCAEHGESDPAAGDNYSASNTDRQSLTTTQRESIARGFSALTDPDIIFQIASAFGSNDQQLALDVLMQYVTWYYTSWGENLALLDAQADSNSNYTAVEQTALKALARIILDRINGANGETQYPVQEIFWLWNMTNPSRQDIVAPAIYVKNSSCPIPGSVSGTVYIDNNGNDSYDSGTEPGIGAITVSLLNDADNAVVATTSTVTNGAYSFNGLDTDLTYRLEVDATDPDLSGNTLGTTNPLTGITVTSGGAVVNQDFGFDPVIASCSTTDLYLGDELSEATGIGAYTGVFPVVHSGTIAGVDNSASILVGGDFTITSGAEAEGKVVILGDMHVASGSALYDIGRAGLGSQIVPASGEDALLVGGNLTVDDAFNVGSGTVYNVRVGGGVGGSATVSPTGSLAQNDASLDLSSYQSKLIDINLRSQYWKTLTPTGTVTVTNSAVTLTGDGTGGIQVFETTAGQLNLSNGQSLQFANLGAMAGTTVLVNVLADATDTAYLWNLSDMIAPDGSQGVNFNSAFAGNILWNFPDATTINLGGPLSGQYWGSVVVPNSASTLNMEASGMNGRMITAGDLIQNKSASEFHNYEFDPVHSLCGSKDYSDAPASYGAPSHTIVTDIHLGVTAPDSEAAAKPGADANLDDNTGVDDEDGVTLPALSQGSSELLTVRVTSAGTDGYLQGWIDWNGNGNFNDSGEQVAANLQDDGTGDDATASDGLLTFSVNVPVDAVTTQTISRFRWSTISGLDATTAASDGEVEDYALSILGVGCSLVVTTTADSDSSNNDSGSLRDAIECANSNPGPDIITFNIPTSEPGYDMTSDVWTISPASQLTAVIDAGTTIDASTQPDASCGDLWSASTGRTLKVQLDGATASSSGYTKGLDVQGDNFALRGISITNFLPGIGVYTQPSANNSHFTCNHIGVAADGMTAGSNSNGMDLRGGNTYLGDVGIGDGNVISGNSLDGGVGVVFNGADTSYVYNNFFGAGLDGGTAVPNVLALWNISSGNMQIGGPSEGQRNLFSGNGSAGITFRGPGTDNSFVQGNYIGTDKTGLTALANHTGVNFGDLSTRIAIGGSGSGEGNVISGNSESGIASGSDVGEDASRNFIFGNIIGLDKNATNALPNQNGIALYEVDHFVIQENTIARNSRVGILLQNGADDVVISHNSIFSNALQGIDLQSHDGSVATSTGVTLNDTNDLDSGANDLLNFPMLSRVELNNGDLVIQGCAPANSIVEVFESDVSAGGSATPGDNTFGLSRDYGEGEIYLFSAVEGSLVDKDPGGCSFPGSDGSDHSSMSAFYFVVPVPADVLIDDVITATATLPEIGTSEFGPMINVTDEPPTIGGGSCPANGGTDILFIVDNSGSISASEFSNFSQSIQDVGSSFMADNPANRIAVAHFGGPADSLTSGGQYVYIERDFSSDAMIAPVRQFGEGGAYNTNWSGDHLAGAVQQMRYALDGDNTTTSGFIISPDKEMSRDMSIPLQVVLMTDADRYLNNTPNDISMLIDPAGSGAEPGDGSDFTIYNQLKAENITFSVVSFNVSVEATAAAGAIASVGGAYTGAIDANSADPEGSQVSPRRYVPVTTGFVLELDQIAEMVDSVAICGNNISGVIFEDTVYGGGNGRAFGGFGTVGLPDASIEVYDSSGDYVAAVNSSVGGTYRLPSLPDGDYFVRVVNGTVSSSRTGSDGSEVPVMTYRSDGITAVDDEIGGRYPALTDAGANADASKLDTTTFMFNSGGLDTLPAQSLQPIKLSGAAVTNANFGFNFNTVVNKQAAGQGSLLQFVLNNNQLESSGIQQQLPALVTADYSTGDSVAVFMIPSSQLVSGEAVIDTMTELRIEQPDIAIDGRVQTANIGSGRVVLRGDGVSLANGISLGEDADNAVLRDFSIESFGGSGIIIFGTGNASGEGARVERLEITANGQYGVLLQNDASNNQIIANAIANNTWAGISSEAVSNNTFSQNSIYGNGGLGIDLGADGVTTNNSTDDWLNYPEVAAGSTISSNGSQVVTYDFDLDVPGNSNGYRVEFFSNTELDPSSHGEGEIYLGYVDITSFGIGLQNFKGVLNANQSVPAEAKISVTLTEKITANSLGATSEFSGVRDGNAAVCTDLLSDPDAPLETVTLDENSGPITLLEANDENGDPITYVISGDADGSQFVITSVPGALIDCFIIEFIDDGGVIGTNSLGVSTMRAGSTVPLPGNYEAPTDGGGDNTYNLVITGTDINGNTVTKPLTVNVQDVNEKPRIISSATVSYDDEQEGAVIDLEAYDPDEGDAEGSGLIFSLSGGADAGKFTVDPYTGLVHFRDAPDFNNPADKDADNVYELTVRVADDQGYASTKSLLINVTGNLANDTVGLRVHALLQGAYIAETGLMHDTLRADSLLPLVQPYANAPFNYTGDELAAADLLAIEGNDAIVDWVLLELRDANDSSQLVAQRAVLLQRDGDVVDAVTGSTELYLSVAEGQYYLSLRHRNHLGVISESPLSFSDDASVNLIDFSQPTTAVQGEHTRLQVAANDANSEISLLWSGDVNQDQRLVASGQGSDLNPILSDVLVSPDNTAYNSSYQVLGYHASDLNMDGAALFMGPGNDANILVGNVLLHPANELFLGNYIIEGGM